MYEPADIEKIALLVLGGDQCRGFSIQSQCWYGESIKKTEREDFIDTMSIGIYANGYDEGTHGEFQIDWTRLDGKMVARLKVFDDSWRVLPLFSDLLMTLMPMLDSNWHAGGDSISSTELGEKLVALGYRDVSKRNQSDSLPSAPDYSRMKMIADQPQRIPDWMRPIGSLAQRPPFVVCFKGGATFDEGVVTDEVRDFVQTNCQHGYVIDPNDIFFEDEGDAMLVSMRYGK